MGIYQTPGTDDDVLKSTKYVGVVPLFKGAEKTDEAVKIVSRFHISPTEMLREVLSGNDYYENPEMLKTRSYSASEWSEMKDSKSEDKVLFGFLNGVGTIELSTDRKSGGKDIGILDAYSAFEIIDFVNKAKEVCRKSLKKQSQRVEENLNCKVKGRILVQKQIKFNLSRGQEQKVYCSYNKMSEDIKENQIIKYALHLCQKEHGVGDSLAEDIRYCMNTLCGVPLKKVSAADFIGLKNNSAFKQYKSALDAARKIIGRYGISYSVDSPDQPKVTLMNGKVMPHFIDVNLLFEYYCRAIFSKAVENYNSEHTEGVSFELESAKDAKRKLFDDGSVISGFFMRDYIPDIVINYTYNGRKKVAAVFDAKNSDVESQEKRGRTHQVLFYMKALGCSFGGLISPYTGAQEGLVSGQITCNGEKSEESRLYYIPLDSKTDFDGYVIRAQSALADIAESLHARLSAEAEAKAAGTSRKRKTKSEE